MTTQERIEAALSGKSSEPILYRCEGCGCEVLFGQTILSDGRLMHQRNRYSRYAQDERLVPYRCGPVAEVASSAEVQTDNVIETTGWGRTAK